MPGNLTKLYMTEVTESDDIFAAFEEEGSENIHVTNGVYSYNADLIVPTTLAGFKYISDLDKVASKKDTFVIAVNSDISMREIYKRKKKNLDAQGATFEQHAALQKELVSLESQEVRAEKVAVPLAQLYPEREIVVIFFDTETPAPLYARLAGEGLNLKSLHKWGYGTDPDPDAPGIEGADNFTAVFGLLLPNNVRPVCHDITTANSRTNAVNVKDLKVEISAHGQPYISTEGKVLFPVPPELKSYHQDSFLRSVHKQIKEHPAANSM